MHFVPNANNNKLLLCSVFKKQLIYIKWTYFPNASTNCLLFLRYTIIIFNLLFPRFLYFLRFRFVYKTIRCFFFVKTRALYIMETNCVQIYLNYIFFICGTIEFFCLIMYVNNNAVTGQIVLATCVRFFLSLIAA